LAALLIALQWATSGTQAFAGQYITGSVVNCVLAVAALVGGLWSGATVAVLSPFFAFLLGIGPKLIQIVPCIALGNLTFVLALHFLREKNRILQVAVSAAAKFMVLYLAVVKVLIPLMGDALKAPQVKTFTLMFSYPQLITALIGGTLAMLLLPALRKAIKS
jgi:LytS/YehU family sensor histidine kinase